MERRSETGVMVKYMANLGPPEDLMKKAVRGRST